LPRTPGRLPFHSLRCLPPLLERLQFPSEAVSDVLDWVPDVRLSPTFLERSCFSFCLSMDLSPPPMVEIINFRLTGRISSHFLSRTHFFVLPPLSRPTLFPSNLTIPVIIQKNSRPCFAVLDGFFPFSPWAVTYPSYVPFSILPLLALPTHISADALRRQRGFLFGIRLKISLISLSFSLVSSLLPLPLRRSVTKGGVLPPSFATRSELKRE